jgi:protein-tyrosine phosphatase
MTQNYHHIPTPSFKGKLYLSDIYGINSIEELNIGYVVSLFPVLENQSIPEGIKHDDLKISDRSDVETILKMNSILNNISLKIADNLSNNINVLVHCFAGVSRSATVVCDFICKYEPTLLDDTGPEAPDVLRTELPSVAITNKVESSIEYVRKFRENIKPNHGFIKLLKIRNKSS